MLIVLFISVFCSQNLLANPDLPPVAKEDWSFTGITGTFPRDALQRGFQVFKEVCASCHSLKHVAYRNLKTLGYNEEQIKAVAAEYQVTDGPNQDGQMFQRPALPSDYFVGPYANDNVARATNNGALPPDLSLIIKARPHGVHYVYALLTGFKKPPKGFHVDAGRYYNEAFPGHMIAMPPPLSDEQVKYMDGTKATVHQMARDVVTFLAWSAEPEMESRKQLGFQVLFYLLVMTVVLYFVKQRIWKDVGL